MHSASSRRFTYALTLLAWLGFIVSGLRLAAHASATYDEVPHIGAGVSYLRGDLRLNTEHPAFTKWLAALALPERDPPLYLSAAPVPLDVQWGFGSAWLHGAKQPPLYLLQRARTPLVLLNALLVPAVALVAYALAGAFAACTAALLAALCPLWLAHGTLVTTDAAASLFCFLASAFAAWLLVAQPARRAPIAIGLAVSLGLALASKYSMLALGPLLILGAWRARGRALWAWLLASVALGTLLGVSFAWGWPPRPGLYWQGMRQVGVNIPKEHVYYAFGELFDGRDPLYFARALLVKLALPVWILGGVALAARLRAWRSAAPLTAAERARTAWRWPLVAVPLGYFALLACSAPARGVRYVLPVVPFMFVLAGVGAARLSQLRAAWVGLALLTALQLASYVSALRATPLGAFNGFFCFTGDALPCLDDSNLDWGQALPELAEYRAEHYPNVPLRVMYHGSSPVEAYVPNAVAANLDEMTRPQAALYAISLHYRVRSPESDWTRRLRPLAIVAGVYAIYDLRSLAGR